MDLIPLYREMAEKGALFWGLSIIQHSDEIHQIVRATKSTTLLDYGCGGGDAYRPPHDLHLRWNLNMPVLYDPAFAAHDVLPDGTFDGVLCSDVLEHVPRDNVRQTIATLFERADRFVWASVCCRLAKKTFADGRNLHVTVRPYQWWATQFDEIGRSISAAKFGSEDGIAWRLTETP